MGATQRSKYGYMDNSSGPQIRRRKQAREKKWVFLSPDLWKELDFVSRFATEAFTLTGKPETVSRNDWIEDAMIWAVASYWADKGGKPVAAGSADYKAKAKRFAERLLEEQKRRDRETAKQSE